MERNCLVLRITLSYNYDLLTRKGVYPYEYVNSWDRFNETQLPPIDVFYSNLNVSSISEEDYQHAQRVWKEFGIHNLRDYHDLYLRTDVVLLANMYEAFRDTCLKHYKLDPVLMFERGLDQRWNYSGGS